MTSNAYSESMARKHSVLDLTSSRPEETPDGEIEGHVAL